MDKEGWHPDPFGTHEERLFKDGELTPVVRDHGIGSYHDPSANHDPSATLTATRDFDTATDAEQMDAAVDAEQKEAANRPRFRSVLSWLAVVVIALLVATGTRAYAVETFFVPSPSMTPTLIPGDRIIVNKLATAIHRGDIIVFHDPPADGGGPPTLVKRVIGLPGEVISSRGSQILIDGKPLNESWLPPLVGMCAEPDARVPTTRIGPGHFFVMGDCRGNSDDSRFWGTVSSGEIIGKVDLVIWRNGHPWLHWF